MVPVLFVALSSDSRSRMFSLFSFCVINQGKIVEILTAKMFSIRAWLPKNIFVQRSVLFHCELMSKDSLGFGKPGPYQVRNIPSPNQYL